MSQRLLGAGPVALGVALLAIASPCAADLAPGHAVPRPPITVSFAPTPPSAAPAAGSASASASAAVPPPPASGAPIAAPSASAPAGPPSAGASASPAASASAAPPADDLCGEGVIAWTKRASADSGLTIAPRSCTSGIVRLVVTGAGCDFEVAKTRGFKRTADGVFGVSPIADLDWGTAPEPMKKAFTTVIAALEKDPTLLVPVGEPRFAAPTPGFFESPRNQVLLGLGSLFGAAALGLWLKRRRGSAAPPPPPPPAA